jgi:hypothetical protein
LEAVMSEPVPAPTTATPSSSKRERSPMEQLFNVTIFIVFVALWAAFAYALVANQGGLDNVWQWSRTLPLLVQAVIWLLTLPLAIALWIWESGWPLLVRLVLVVGIGGWNLWMFFPSK